MAEATLTQRELFPQEEPRTRWSPKTQRFCKTCNVSFLPNSPKHVYCRQCKRFCPKCGKPKNVDSKSCRRCSHLARIGQPMPSSRRPAVLTEQAVAWAESLGHESGRQFAFGYVIGVVLGDGSVSAVTDNIKHHHIDGSVSVHPQTSFRVALQVTSEAFARCFADEWKTLTGRDVSVWSAVRTDFSKSTLPSARDDYSVTLFMCRPRHKVLAHYLRHVKYERPAEMLLQHPPDVQDGILQGMIDAEGYISKQHQVAIVNKNRDLLRALGSILDRQKKRWGISEGKTQDIARLYFTCHRTKKIS